jgi:RNA polymerase sigma factor (TIGR02999 family)
MSDVTQILNAIEEGDARAAEKLLPLVYQELRHLAAAKMAREKPGQTLQATALVHEAYIRLVDVEKAQHWNSRGHFFAAAGEAMRRLLVERARRKQTLKHGGGWRQVELSEPDLVTGGTPDQVVALHEALENLEQEEPDATRLVKLVTFAGFSVEQAGQLLEMSRTTAYRHWSYARAWIKTHIADEEDSSKK